MVNDTYIDWSKYQYKYEELHSDIIIRCKNCKYYKEINKMTRYKDCVHPKGLDSVRENDFCSYAKIKECSE